MKWQKLLNLIEDSYANTLLNFLPFVYMHIYIHNVFYIYKTHIYFLKNTDL